MRVPVPICKNTEGDLMKLFGIEQHLQVQKHAAHGLT